MFAKRFMSKHILLIDDDSDESDFFMLALKEMPGLFKFSYIEHAVEAVNAIIRLKPDLIFLDINMPLMNGFECLAQIRKADGVADVPVIMYSTHVDDNARNTAQAVGGADCMRKPALLSGFKKMLKDLLGSFKNEGFRNKIGAPEFTSNDA